MLRRTFYWPTLVRDTRKYVNTCRICQLAKQRTPRPRQGALHPIVYDHPMQTVSIDVVGPFSPISKRGNRYIFVIVDNFTNYLWLHPVPDETATTTATILLDLFLKHGFPVQNLSDRGANFVSEIVQELLRLFRVKTLRTTAYHPQTDGKNEVSHRLLLSQIRAFISKGDYGDWDLPLPFFAFAVNAAPIADTTYSPFYLFYGRNPVAPNDVAFSSDVLLRDLVTTPTANTRTLYVQMV